MKRYGSDEKPLWACCTNKQLKSPEMFVS